MYKEPYRFIIGIEGAGADNNTTLTKINDDFTINPKTILLLLNHGNHK